MKKGMLTTILIKHKVETVVYFSSILYFININHKIFVFSGEIRLFYIQIWPQQKKQKKQKKHKHIQFDPDIFTAAFPAPMHTDHKTDQITIGLISSGS